MSSTKIKSSEGLSHCIPPWHAKPFKTTGPILAFLVYFGIFWHHMWHVGPLGLNHMPQGLHTCKDIAEVNFVELRSPYGSQEDPSWRATVAPTVATGKMRELKVSQSCVSMSFCGRCLFHFLWMKSFQRLQGDSARITLVDPRSQGLNMAGLSSLLPTSRIAHTCAVSTTWEESGTGATSVSDRWCWRIANGASQV